MLKSQLNKSYFYTYDNKLGWNYTTFLSIWNDFYREDENIKYAEFTIVYVLSILSLLINCGMIYLFLYKKQLKANQTVYIITVMITSILYAPFCFVIGATRLTNGWVYGDVGCQLVMFATVNTAFVKLSLTATISIDRCLNIVRNYKVPKKYMLLAISIALITPSASSLALTSQYTRTLNVTYGVDNFKICTAYFPKTSVHISKVIFFVFFVVFFVIPVIVTAICNARIIYHVNNATMLAARSLISGRKRYVTRVLLFILILFVVMWLPFYIILAFVAYDEAVQNFYMTSRFVIGVVCLQIVNTILEPFLYTCTSARVRRQVFALCLSKKNSYTKPKVSSKHEHSSSI